MAWNSNGTKLASGSVDQTARVWTIEPHGHVIFYLCLWFLQSLCLYDFSYGKSNDFF